MRSSARQLRRELHARPELSGKETGTAARLREFFSNLDAGFSFEEFDGAGFAAILGSTGAGPTITLRAELDALPITETNKFAHRSRNAGVAHKCGHDGHMAILAAVGERLAAAPPPPGRVVLLFQAAEETGAGARAIVNHPRFKALAPDRVFALHNLPGYPMGKVVLRDGTFSCASRGMHITLQGREAHAAQPETGISPARAIAEIINLLQGLETRMQGQAKIAFATVVYALLGKPAYGITPGHGEVMATLRSDQDEVVDQMTDLLRSETQDVCARGGLEFGVGFADDFPATVNARQAFAEICGIVESDQLILIDSPFRWSEDFGHFTAQYPGAMFGLGAGEDVPALHHPEYDFPDPLIATGSGLFLRLIDNILGLRAS